MDGEHCRHEIRHQILVVGGVNLVADGDPRYFCRRDVGFDVGSDPLECPLWVCELGDRLVGHGHNELDPRVGERCQDLGIRVVDSSLGDLERREEVKYFLR